MRRTEAKYETVESRIKSGQASHPHQAGRQENRMEEGKGGLNCFELVKKDGIYLDDHVPGMHHACVIPWSKHYLLMYFY
jgi:hypothetical protein